MGRKQGGHACDDVAPGIAYGHLVQPREPHNKHAAEANPANGNCAVGSSEESAANSNALTWGSEHGGASRDDVSGSGARSAGGGQYSHGVGSANSGSRVCVGGENHHAKHHLGRAILSLRRGNTCSPVTRHLYALLSGGVLGCGVCNG